jgi:phosphatidylglycerol---prolipoprotein diacylglyceryl transferase
VTLALDPVAFSILGLPVRWYGLFVAASIRVAYLIARSLARRRGVADSLVADGALQPVEHPRLLEVRR